MREIMRRKRGEKGLTQEALARLVGISRTCYTNIETGRKNPSFGVSIRIKKVLSYDSDDIFTNI